MTPLIGAIHTYAIRPEGLDFKLDKVSPNGETETVGSFDTWELAWEEGSNRAATEWARYAEG